MPTLRIALGRLVTIALLALAVALLPVVAAAQPAVNGRTVRLVQLPDGGLKVQTGASFSSAVATVLVEETDTVLRMTGGMDVMELDASGVVTDERREQQWHLDAVEAERAWRVATGERQVIAIVDTGVDGTHPDLRDRLVDGWSAVGGDPLVDTWSHGTHVAGIAAASVGDDYGVAGLAPEADLMPIQVFSPWDGTAYASDVAAGVIWAVDHGATVINLSLAGPDESDVLNGAIDYAIDAGIPVVVSAGNAYRPDNPRMYPASHPDVIAVGSIKTGDVRSPFSSTGDYVDIAAPGTAIMSTKPGELFGFASGTSMAAPLVAGAVALLQDHDADLSVEDVRDLLTETARDLGPRGRDDEFGHGALDLIAALTDLGADIEDEVRSGEPAAEDDPTVEDAPVEEEVPAEEVAAPPAPRPAAPTTHFGR